MANPNSNQVIIYRDADYKGKTATYTGVQEQRNLHDQNWPGTHNNESTDISSFKVGSGVWFTAYTEYGLTGGNEIFPPGTEHKDLNLYTVTINGQEETWNNAIKSFMITDSNPAG